MVVGAGPAGSTLARDLARHGVRVLLLDRARFPRDKPCGGGVTVRAASCLDLDLTPVVERTIYAGRFTFRRGRAFLRRSPRPLTYMTRRACLDLFLAERAADAGVDFHHGEAVRSVEVRDGIVEVGTDKGRYSAQALAGADGVNGIVGRSTGTAPQVDLAVAIEGNMAMPKGVPERWQDAVGMDLGDLPGGYGWLFPKSDHLNVGVGAWRFFAPHLRRRLAALCQRYRLRPEALCDVRGYHLPVRRPGSRIARGPVLTVGDAAGLVDPLSGEGIWGAFLSAHLASRAIVRYLERTATDVSPYEAAVEEQIQPELTASRTLQDIFHYAPRPYVFTLQYSRRFWHLFCRIIRGEITYVDFLQAVGPLRLLVDIWDIVARRSRLPPP